MRRGEARSRQFAKRLRKEMTEAEVLLWTFLRKRAVNGFKFRRQHPVGPYVADFACVSEKLIVEVDGATHWTPAELAHDAKRTAYLQTNGWRLMRVSNAGVFEDLNAVWLAIARQLPPPSASPTPPPRAGEEAGAVQ